MKCRIVGICSILLLNTVTGLAWSQELDLFQAVENTEENQENSRRTVRPERQTTEPAFTLVGTSRFGERYVASLLARDGQKVTVEWEKSQAKEILGYRGFSVVDMGSRRVTLDLPENESCVENEAKGVKCNGSYALLSLSVAQPIEQIAEQNRNTNIVAESAPGTESESDAEEAESEPRVFRNPFTGEMQELPELTPEEQAAREERRQRRAEQFRNFEIVRIPDDEIPEGMQRIRTPFGDSLEPIEE